MRDPVNVNDREEGLAGIGTWTLVLGDSYRLHLSPEGCRLLGITSKDEASLFQQALASLDEDARKEFESLARTSIDEEAPFSFLSRIPNPNGSETCIQWLGGKAPEATDGFGTLTGILKDISAEKAAEQEQHRNERLIKLAGTMARIGGWEVDLQTNTIFWSDQTCAIHEMPRGFTPSVEEGISFYAPEWRSRITELFTQCAENGVPYDEELEIITAGNRRLWVRAIAEAARDKNGRIVRVHGAFGDISDRKQAELNSLLKEAQYRSLFEDNYAVMLIIDAESGQIRDANPAAVNFYGWNRDTLRQMSISDINTLDKEEIDREMRRARSREQHQFLFRHRLADGSERDVEVFSGPIRFQDCACLYSIIHDISQRRAVEKALRRSEAQFRTLVEGAPDGIFTQANKRFVYVNKAFCQLMGAADSSELVGQLVINHVHPDYREQAMQRIRALNQEQTPQALKAMRFIRLDGVPVDVEISGVPLVVEETFGALAFARDVTEKKRFEEHVQDLQRMESIGTLANGIAHDLNNLLVPVMMGAELLKSRCANPEAQPLLEEILQSAHRGSTLVKQILSFARSARGERVEVSLPQIVEAIQSISQRTLPPGVNLETEVSDDLWTLNGDPGQLQQSLLNLVLNARDAMRDGGTIRIRARNQHLDAQYVAQEGFLTPGPHVLIEVEDTGVGIPAHLLKRIFEPFYTTRERGQATGLGLATALGIVKSHKGTIRVRSQPGEGSVFSVLLPADAEEAPPPEASIRGGCGNGRLLLIVDDNAPVLTVTRKSLEASQYRVLTALNGASAVQLYASRHCEISLVISEMSMSDMGGDMLAAILRKIDPDSRIILTSTHEKTQTWARANQCGFLQKPFSTDTLLMEIEQALSDKASPQPEESK